MLPYLNRGIAARCALLAVAALAVTSARATKPYTAYPGTLPARVVGVENAMVINIDTETWPGFRRAFRITLPGIQVPADSRDAPTCEREMAERALTFTEVFLYDAKQVEVRDIRMANSADADGEANLYTEQGSLAAALQAARLARPDNVDPKHPWCP